jgi:hypothetical protein
MKYLLLFVFCMSTLSQAATVAVDKRCQVAKMITSAKKILRLAGSAIAFWPSRWYNKIWYGRLFTFNRIAGEKIVHQEASISKNLRTFKVGAISFQIHEGKLVGMNDGKKTPLVLGSIPCTPKHIALLRRTYALNATDSIAIHTLNRTFERDWAGLSDLQAQDSSLRVIQYPTIDYGAPSFINVLRAVRNLENRDSGKEKLALVHCKAGRGRSATVIAAYLIHLFHQVPAEALQGLDVIALIEDYLKLIRPQVSLNADHKKALRNFSVRLKAAGSLQNLIEQHKHALAARDAVIA